MHASSFVGLKTSFTDGQLSFYQYKVHLPFSELSRNNFFIYSPLPVFFLSNISPLGTPHLKNQVRLRNDSTLTGTSVPEWNIAILISWIVSEQICWRYLMLLLVFHFCEDMLLRRNRRLFLFGFPRKLWVRAEIFKPHLRMFRAISSYTNYNDI